MVVAYPRVIVLCHRSIQIIWRAVINYDQLYIGVGLC